MCRSEQKSKMAQGRDADSDLSTKEAERLIEAVRDHPCLYDMSCLEYRYTNRKENAWEAVRVTCRMKTIDEAKKAWKRLRDRYVRELRALEEATRSGSDSIRKKHLGFLEVMSFYKSHARPRNRTANNVSAPSECGTPEAFNIDMIEWSPEDSTILTGTQPGELDDPESLDATEPPMPASSSSRPPMPGPAPPTTRQAKRVRPADPVEQELLGHLSRRMSENEAFGYSIAQSLDRWDTITSARFKSAVMQLALESEIEFQKKNAK